MRQVRAIARLKKDITAKLVDAVGKGDIDGHDALGVLMVLSARMVAQVEDEDTRDEFVRTVLDNFETAVVLERQLPVTETLQ
jgi:hypothetical protein